MTQHDTRAILAGCPELPPSWRATVEYREVPAPDTVVLVVRCGSRSAARSVLASDDTPLDQCWWKAIDALDEHLRM